MSRETPMVLVAENDPSLAELLVHLLTGAGYGVATAANGRDAIQAASEAPFEVAVVHYRIPGIAGAEVLRGLLNAAPDIAVIMMTGMTEVAPAVEAMKSGAYDYVVKPVSPTELLVRVEQVRERRRLVLGEKRYRQNLVQAQDDEREWTALEVHDRIAQSLASIFQQLQVLEGMTRPYPEIRQAVVRSSLWCREVIWEARNIMYDLWPPVLEELGLVPAMEEDLRHLAEEASCQVEKVLSAADRFPRAVELTLYRVFHEAVVNIRRHARARTVKVSLVNRGDGVSLEVRDDGVGFDVQAALARPRVGGLLSMRRRTELARGTWHLESQPGGGTTMRAWLPLSPPAV
ncbi:MAG: response regulator [Chloroflexi bacterium]|nr:response regulator [Chloroflexota bacterium]